MAPPLKKRGHEKASEEEEEPPNRFLEERRSASNVHIGDWFFDIFEKIRKAKYIDPNDAILRALLKTIGKQTIQQ